jgi:hypothetical protein
MKIFAWLDVPGEVKAEVESHGLQDESWVEKIAFNQVQRRSEIFDARKVGLRADQRMNFMALAHERTRDVRANESRSAC